MQATLERLLRKWDRLNVREPAAFVRRVLINEHRRQVTWRRSRREVTFDTIEHGRAVADAAASVPTSLTLYAALGQLSRRQRQAVVLHHLEDLTIPATAELLGCSPGAAKRYAHDGLVTLRGLMEHVEIDPRSPVQ